LRSIISTQPAHQLGDLAHRLQGLLDASVDCVLFLDASGNILAASRAVEDVFGYEEAELLDAPISRLVPEGLGERLREGRLGPRFALAGRCYDGREVSLMASLSALDEQGKVLGLVLREAPMRLTEASPSASIGSFGPPDSTKHPAATQRSNVASDTARTRASEAETLELMFNVTSTANEAKTLEEALAIALELICHHFGWHLAHACLVHRVGEPELRSSELWFGNFSPVYAATRRERPAAGLTGMALALRRPQVLSAQQAAERDCTAFPANHTIGLAFPVIAQGQVLAIVEAYSLTATEVEPAALSILQLVGSQLGQVAERERREQDLRAALQAAESAGRQKSDFLSNMSHEFRTPMHAIINYANLSLRALDRSELDRVRRSVAAIQVSGKRLLTLLNDILDLAKMEAGRFVCNIVQASFTAVVERAVIEVEPLAAAKSIRLVQHVTHTDELRFDEPRLAQVLVNLLSNAIKFSPTGVAIVVLVANGTLNDAPAVRCRIDDEGVGIPPGELESIFDKFEQSRRTKSSSGGTGLGLAICRQIIAAHQGVIFAENRAEGGASFTFLIPRAPSDTTTRAQ